MAGEDENLITHTGEQPVPAAKKPAETDRTIDDLLESLGGGALGDDDIMLKAFKLDKKTGDKIWCATYSVSDMPLEPKLAEFGGGAYRVEVWAKTERGNKAPRGHVRFLLDESIRPKPKDSETKPAPDMAAVVDTMFGKFAEVLKQVTDAGNSKLEAVLARVAPAGGALQQGAITVDHLMALAPMIQKLSGGAPGDPIAQLMQFAKMKEQLRELFADGGGGEGWGPNTALRALETLKEVLINKGQAGMAPGAASNPTAPDGGAMADLATQLKAALVYLCGKAAKGRNAAEMAEDVLDQIPDQYDDQLFELLGDTDAQAVTNLAGLHADVLQYRAWFESFCAAVRSRFTDEPEASAPAPD
jgi:hypothetical protein